MKGFLGGLLLAVGILIAGASGLCTIVFWGLAIADAHGSDFLGFLLLSLMVGGIPFVIGVGLILWGRWLLRRARAAAVGVDQGINSVEP